MMEKPDIDTLEGLSPHLDRAKIDLAHPRSTVGTVTEIYDYLRLLYAVPARRAAGSSHRLAPKRESNGRRLLQHPEGTALMLLALPSQSARRACRTHRRTAGGGFVRARIDGRVVELDQAPKLDVRRKHTVEAIVDRFKVRPDLSQRLAESLKPLCGWSGRGACCLHGRSRARRTRVLDKFAWPICNYSLSELEPRLFSFNSPIGACPACDGLGTQDFFDPEKMSEIRICRWPAARARLGSAQRLLLSADPIVGAAYKFDIEAPFENLPQTIKDLVLFGSGRC